MTKEHTKDPFVALRERLRLARLSEYSTEELTAEIDRRKELKVLKTVKKIHTHISCVQEALLYIVDELRMRAFCHDSSKLEQDELTGYARFEDFPEGLEYGSEAYEAAMAKVMEGNDCFKLHSQRNDHHPEHFEDVQKMRFHQILEMVSDWAGAHKGYGNSGGWHKSVEDNIAKHNFLPEQEWLIRDVSLFLSSRIPDLQDQAQHSE